MMTEAHSANNPVVLANGSKRSKSSLSPQLKIEPASEWANHTITALDSTEVTQLPSTTPRFELPGGYPYTPTMSEPGPSFEDIKGAAKEYLCAAGQYVPSQEDVKWIAQSAGSTVRGYIPDGVAAYLGPPQPTQEPISMSPVEESETTPTAAGAFVLINRGNRGVGDDTRGNHDAKHESVIRPGAGHAEDKPSDTPVAEHSNLVNGQADSNASTKTQPGSRADTGRMEVIGNGMTTPLSYREPVLGTEVVGSSAGSQVYLAPAPNPEGNNSGAVIGDYGSPKAENAKEAPRTEVVGNLPSDPVPQETARTPKECTNKELEKHAHNGARQRLSSKQLVKQSVVDPSETGALRQPVDGFKAGHDGANTMPQTRLLEKTNLQRHRDALGEEDRDLAIDKPTGLGIPVEDIQTAGNGSSATKTDMNKVFSSTATTGHDIDETAPKSSATESRFTEPSVSQIELSPGQIEHPHPPVPPNGAYGSSTAAPEAEETSKRVSCHARVKQQGRRKDRFLTKIKDWSKRMSQDRRAKD